MPINVSGTDITGGSSVSVTDSSGRILFDQDSSGVVRSMRNANGTTGFPLFKVGLGSTGSWRTGTQTVPANYTSADGYRNVGNCYNTTNYRFTAPWDGVYLFHVNAYTMGTRVNIADWTRMMFLVNGSISTRRPGTPYRMRVYGTGYQHGTDSSEIIPLIAGDYVQVYFQQSNGEYYDSYSSWQGVYLGASS